MALLLCLGPLNWRVTPKTTLTNSNVAVVWFTVVAHTVKTWLWDTVTVLLQLRLGTLRAMATITARALCWTTSPKSFGSPPPKLDVLTRTVVVYTSSVPTTLPETLLGKVPKTCLRRR